MIILLAGRHGSGKSTIAKIIRTYGFRIIEADRIGHEVLRDKKCQLRRLFGKVIDKAGRVQRKKIREIVFSDQKKLRQLEKLVHPEMRNKIIRKTRKGNWCIVAAIPFKLKLFKISDHSIAVIGRETGDTVLRFQPSEDRLKRHADSVINNRSMAQSAREVKRIISQCSGQRHPTTRTG